MPEVIEFKANYNRTGKIWRQLGLCHGCNTMKIVICIDSSEKEYGPGQICLGCFKQLPVLQKPPDDSEDDS